MCSRLTARNLLFLLTATPWASAAALPRGSSERVANEELHGLQVNPRQTLAQDPAQVNMIRGRRKASVFHVGDVAAPWALIATCRRLSPSIGMVRKTPSD